MMHPTDTNHPTTEETASPLNIPKDVPPHFVIKELCADLARSFAYSPTDAAVLDDQVQILNALFNATLAERLNMDKQRYESVDVMNRGWLELALKIQKQCMETVRTRQAADYMQGLCDLQMRQLTTPPRNNRGTK
jgi:hypothetical protein